jgi:hypothetical protein
VLAVNRVFSLHVSCRPAALHPATGVYDERTEGWQRKFKWDGGGRVWRLQTAANAGKSVSVVAEHFGGNCLRRVPAVSVFDRFLATLWERRTCTTIGHLFVLNRLSVHGTRVEVHLSNTPVVGTRRKDLSVWKGKSVHVFDVFQ